MKNDIKIIVSNIVKTFGNVVALNDISIDFVRGNLYGVIGPAGAGKTTLFRIVLQLLRPDSGTIKYWLDGQNIAFKHFAPYVAYMPQSQSLYSDLSVDEHLNFFKDLYGIASADFKVRRDKLLHLTRMGAFTDRPAGKLSGGMYKKLGLMCALLRLPRIMLLDEPTNGVDPISRREFWDLLNAALADGILIIISTAYMDEAERCGQVILMESGNVLASGEPRALLDKKHAANFDELFVMRGGEK